GSHAPALRLDRRDAPGPHRRVQRCRRDRQIPTASLYADLDRLGADAARAAIRGLTRPARPEVAAGQFRSCPENAGLGVGQSAPQRVFPGSGLAPALPTYMLATRTGVRLQPPFRGPGNPSLGIEVNEALPTTDYCRFRDATD